MNPDGMWRMSVDGEGWDVGLGEVQHPTGSRLC